MEDQRNLPNDDASVNRNPEENSDGSESDDVEEVSWEELFDKIPNSFSIRVVCVLIVICTIIQASMGAAVWNFMVPVSTRYGTGAGTGAWWAPFPSLVRFVIFKYDTLIHHPRSRSRYLH